MDIIVGWFSLLFPFVDFVYILQLEDYDSRAYWNWIKDRSFRRNLQKNAKINWTKKAILIAVIALLLYIIFIFYAVWLIVGWPYFIFWLLLVTLAIPLFVWLANIIAWPIDYSIKRKMIREGIKRVESMQNLRTVAIIGSFGKTTTRWFTTTLLSDGFLCQTPPENYNTLLSLANETTKLTSDTDFWIVELGEYKKGDLLNFRPLVKPDLVVLTAIGSQHLNSFSSQEAIDDEFVSYLNDLPDNTVVFINSTDEGVKRILSQIKHAFKIIDQSSVKHLLLKHRWPTVLKVDYLIANAAAAVAVGEYFKLSKPQLVSGLEKLTAFARRSEILESRGITIIDDSYNISPETSAAAVKRLGKQSGRKVIVSGGIVDQGMNEQSANVEYGCLIAQNADLLILAETRLAKYLKRGVEENHQIPIVISHSQQETPQILREQLCPGDTVLIQNELPDLYWF